VPGPLPERADAVVVGGGIVGAASAYFLALRGLSVVLLERATIGAEQSSRNWGFVRQQGRHPLELPLAIESNRLWRSLESDLRTDFEWTPGGNLALAMTPKQLGRYERWLEIARSHGLETRLLTAAEVHALLPGLHGRFLGGLHTPSDGHADPGKATAAFAAAAAGVGGTVVRGCAVDRIVVAHGAVAGVVTERGEIATSQVVCAAGVWSARLLGMLGLHLPRRLVRATVQRTTPAPPITQAGVWAGAFSFRQRRDGRVILAGSRVEHDVTLESLRQLREYLPNYWRNRHLFRLHIGRALLRDLADAIAPGDRRRHPFRARHAVEPKPNAREAAQALATFRRRFPGIGALGSEQRWAGVIDTTPDAVPVIDAVAAPRGLVVATGFSGHGFALGPIAGRLVSELVADEAPSLDLHGFRLARFAEGDLAEPRAVL